MILLVIVLITVLVILYYYYKYTRHTCDLVIARYRESLKWLSGTFPAFRRIYVYNKGPMEGMDIPAYLMPLVKIVPMENVGRCDQTYLHHILTEYDDLADVTVFLPGSCDLKNKRNILQSIKSGKTSINYNVKGQDKFHNVSKFSLNAYNASHPSNANHDALKKCPQRPFGKWFRHIFGSSPIKTVTYLGIFAISRDDIRRRPRELYALLKTYLDDHPNPEAGHYLERAWGMVFMEPDLQFRNNADLLRRHDASVFRDEHGQIIDHKNVEREEQLTVLEFVRSDANVLELGARYGTVTCMLDKILKVGKGWVVTSEPDASVHEALYQNLSANGCTRTKVIHSIVGDSPVVLSGNGYGTQALKSTRDDHRGQIDNISLKDLQENFGFKFDTVMADCEGCFEEFVRHCDRQGLLHQFETIIYEMDYADTCNYPWIEQMLKNRGMVKVRDAFLTVWQKKM